MSIPFLEEFIQRKDVPAAAKYAAIDRVFDRLEQRKKNLETLATTFVQVQESEDMAYVREHGELPPPEWRSPVVANLLTQPA